MRLVNAQGTVRGVVLRLGVTPLPLQKVYAVPDNDARNLVLSDFEPYLSSLKPLPIWVGWRKSPDKERPGKVKKPPHSPLDGSSIGATSKWPIDSDQARKWAAEHPGQRYSDHWLPFADAWPGILHHRLEGPGLVIRKEDGLVGVDFDDCVSNGVIDPNVIFWLKNYFGNTYAEFSPSGTGVHVLGRGKICKSLMKTPLPKSSGVTVEVYDCDRFFTFSGRPVPL